MSELKNYSTLIEITCKLHGTRKQKRKKAVLDAAESGTGVSADYLIGGTKTWETADITRTLTSTLAAIGTKLKTDATDSDGGKYSIQASKFEAIKIYLDAQCKIVSDLLEEMASDYPNLIAAERAAKGVLFDLADYETPSEIRAKKPSWTYQPSPDAAALANCFDDSEFARDVIRDFEKQQESKYREIDGRLLGRVENELIDGVCKKIAKFVASGKGISAQSVYDQLIFAKELASRNMTDCTKLDRARTVLGRIVSAYQPEHLRDGLHAAAIADDCRSIFSLPPATVAVQSAPAKPVGTWEIAEPTETTPEPTVPAPEHAKSVADLLTF